MDARSNLAQTEAQANDEAVACPPQTQQVSKPNTDAQSSETWNQISSSIPFTPDSIPDLGLEKTPFAHGLPMTIGFKMLATCISFTLFALLAALVFALTSTKESVTSLTEDELLITMAAAAFALIVLAVMVVLVGIYLLVYYFNKKHGESRFCRAFRRRGLFILLIGFILIALCVAAGVMCHTQYQKIALVGILVAALIAFLPVTITWHVQEEERLKNFIDGFSKTCSCLAFMGGAIALLLKTFIL